MGAAGQGGQPLDVDAEQPGDRLGLGVAELGELLGDPAHRAVTLAELDAGEPAGADRPGGGGEAVLGQGLDEEVGPGDDVVAGRRRGASAYRPSRPPTRSLAKSATAAGPACACEVAQRLDRELVVVGRERAVAALGDDVGAGGATPAAGVSRTTRVVLVDGAVVGQGVEVAADGRGGQPEEPADLGRAHRSVLGHGGQDALARPLLVGPDKHHTIVT